MKDLLGNEAFDWNCWDTCHDCDCILYGCRMKRKPPRPDTRLDWRDPQMPVLRDYKMPDGSRKTEIDPDYERRYREHLMNTVAVPKEPST